MNDSRVKAGSVVQITGEHGREGWIGALVVVTEVKSWGVQGFVPVIESHGVQRRAYIRLTPDHYAYVGEATMVPAESADEIDP